MHRLLVARLAPVSTVAWAMDGALPAVHALELLLDALQRQPTAHLNLACSQAALEWFAARPAMKERLELLASLGAIEFVATTPLPGADFRELRSAFEGLFPPTLRPQSLWPAGLQTSQAIVAAAAQQEFAWLFTRDGAFMPADATGATLASLAAHAGLFLLPVDAMASERLLAGPDEAQLLLNETPSGPALAQIVGAEFDPPPSHLGGLVRLLEHGRTVCVQDLSSVVRGRRLVSLSP
jgi:hypothetical protein